MLGLNIEGSQVEQASISGKADNPFKTPDSGTTTETKSPTYSSKGNITICILLVIIAALFFMHFKKKN